MLYGMAFGIALLSLLIAAASIAGRTAQIRYRADRNPTHGGARITDAPIRTTRVRTARAASAASRAARSPFPAAD